MKTNCGILFLFLALLTGCNEDEKISEIVDDGVAGGAFIRTMGFTNSDLVLNDETSTFSVLLELQDEQEGSLVENVEVFARFNDTNLDDGNQSSQEVLVKTLTPGAFTIGPDNLPQTTLELTYTELAAATNISSEDIKCKDQFLVRLVLNLTDGRSFSSGNNEASSVLIAFDTLFSSPFCYTLNIVDPIPAEQFVGVYEYRSLIDGPIGPTFGNPNTVTIRVGESPNTRVFEADYIVSRLNEPSRTFRFLIACDEALFRKNQLSSFFSWCRPGGGFSFGGSPILLGPDTTNAVINPNDDSVFELHFVEGYLGWDGDCDFGTVPVKIVFTKQ